MARKHLDNNTRLQVALAALGGKDTVAEVCNRYGICEATYYRIRDNALALLENGLGTQQRKGGREAQLEREVQNLKEVVADYAAAVHILKKNALRR